MTEITPARLREIADEWARLRFNETAAAFRAAADQIEDMRKSWAATGNAAMFRQERIDKLTVTLAARDALLAEAKKQADEYVEAYEWWSKDEYDRDKGWMGECADDFRALAAEIASALKETSDD